MIIDIDEFYGGFMKKMISMTVAALLLLPLSLSAAIESGYLRDKLPQNTLMYLRVPHHWGVSSAAKDTRFNQVLSSEINQKTIAQIDEGLYKNVWSTLDNAIQSPVFSFLNHHIRSPYEVVAYLPENAPIMALQVLSSAKLNLNDTKVLQKLLESMAASTEAKVNILQAFDEKQFAQITVANTPMMLHYDSAQQRLYTLSSMAAMTPSALKKAVSLFQTTAEHPMFAVEKQFDNSGQGLFFWVNAGILLPIIKPMMPPAEKEQLTTMGLFGIHSMALGLGTADKKGRLKFNIDFEKSGLLNYLPAIENSFTVNSAGKPDFLVSFSLPLKEVLMKVEQALQTFAPADYQEYQAASQQFEQLTGISLLDAADIFAGEHHVFTDKTGYFYATKIKNKATLDKLLTWVATSFQGELSKKTIKNIEYYELNYSDPSLQDMEKELKQLGDEHPVLNFVVELLTRLRSRAYWREEGEYLVFSSFPQMLYDRALATDKQALQHWLTTEQHQNAQHSLFLLSTQPENISRFFYYAYLGSLNLLADLAKTKIDIAAFPSALELNLPRWGTYAAQLDLSENQANIELIFENNPLEFLINHMGTVAFATGIGAAVALPAYMKAQERAQIFEEQTENTKTPPQQEAPDQTQIAATGVSLLYDFAAPAEQYYLENEELPTLEDLGVSLEGSVFSNVEILEEEEIGYAATFRDQELGVIFFTYDEDGEEWLCEADQELVVESSESHCELIVD